MLKKNIIVLSTILLYACSSGTNIENTQPTQVVASPEPAPTEVIPTPTAYVDASGKTILAGYQLEELSITLDRPTQMIMGLDGNIWVAQLSGSEGAGSGQVVSISLDNGTSETLVTDLLNPTGIAIANNYLWIAAGRDLLRAPIEDGKVINEVEIVLKDLPFNSRSNGTLTASPQNMLLYETSGAGPHEEENRINSGILWELDPSNPQKQRQLANGLKNPYAHVFDSQGRLWVTEISDDNVDGQAPPDEINLITSREHFGWPLCYGKQIPARNYGGTQAYCDNTISPVALLPPHATPTSIVVSPWAPDTLLVPYWVTGEIMRIPITQEDSGQFFGEPEVMISGFLSPQHLLVIDDKLLISEHSTGKLYYLRPKIVAE